MTPDISILSDEFLAEVQQLEKKNPGLEALRKLLNDEIDPAARPMSSRPSAFLSDWRAQSRAITQTRSALSK
jgi:type I restriction enzyme, R subunit